MEENNYGFKFNPESNIEKNFTDSNGRSKIIITGDDAPLNMPDKVTIANRPNNGKKRVLVKENKMSQGSNIGPGSNGFAGVATLAGIIAIAGVIIAYLVLRY